jgi:HupE / UreJ protein
MKFDLLRNWQLRASAAVVAAILLFTPGLLSAHDIPNDVTVQAFLKPTGDRLHLLVRVPLKAMRDVDFPLRWKEGFMDIERTEPLLPDAATLWISDFIDLYENNTVLPKPRVAKILISLPSDRSFTSYDAAMAHVTGPELDSNVFWDQVMLDVLFEYPIHSDQSRFSIAPGGLNRLGLNVVTVLSYVLPNGTIRAFEFTSDPGLVRLDPQWYQAAGRFVEFGFRHILDGTDHLLFLFCLVIPFRKFRGLIPVVTAFTVAHSITLIASAYNLAPDASWFPPLIETLIAVSIVYMALENIVGGATVKRRWMIAFGFGLVHGFGFSFALRQTLQLAGSHMLTSLLSFNIGVELGQLLVLAMLIPALELLFRYAVAERTGTIILSALVAHTAWHWMIDRWGVLSKYHIEMPVFDAALWASVLRWLMFIVIGCGAAWFIAGLVRERNARRAAARVQVEQ